MAADEEVEVEENYDEFSEDFDPEADDDLELDDLDDDSFDDVESNEPSPSGNLDVSEERVEAAVVANPKRAQARKKSRSIVEGIVSDADLKSDDGQERAWKKLSERTDTSLARPYAVDMEVTENDTISHPNFGVGFVLDIPSPTKVTVLFETGVRKLRCKSPV